MNVGVTNHHFHVGDAVDMQDEFVELLKLAGLDPIHREPAKLCPILRRRKKKKGIIKRGAVRGTTKQDEETGILTVPHKSHRVEVHRACGCDLK